MKILHIERKFIAPTETFIANQINALSGTNENYVFATQRFDNLAVVADIRVPPALRFSTKILRNSHKDFFVKEEKLISPDLIHAHFISDACLFHSFTKNLSIPKVCSCYGYDVTEVPKKFKYFYKHFYDKVIKEYDYFLAMSEDMKLDLLKIGVPESKIRIHYHGINTKNFNLNRDYRLTHDTINLLTVASLTEKKGHLTVLEALTKVKKNCPDLKFKYHMVGSGHLEKELKTFVNRNNLKDEVHFHGLVKHGAGLKELIQSADIFVHPSTTTRTNDKEGIPGALIEAMASGLPVISTYHAGIPEIIKTGVNGILIPEKDATLLANYVVELSKNPERRKLLGSAALNYANENLDFLMKAEALKEIYHTLISTKSQLK